MILDRYRKYRINIVNLPQFIYLLYIDSLYR
ncbi:MAG: hypothetical protein [Podoviridae sp. ctLUJ1]|nr:MAG: hypothetical protein [Podoviridae sp. ctLUJ1]